MPIQLKNVARVELPADESLKALILGMYSYTSRSGEIFYNYTYQDGVAYLPPNVEKLKIVGSLLGEEIVDLRSEGSPLLEPFILQGNFKFRSYQEGPAKEFVNYLKDNKYGTLSAGTGLGKTVVMTYAYGMLGGKALILVDQSNLIPSWEEAAMYVWGRKLQHLKSGVEKFDDVGICTFQLLAKNDALLRAVSKEYKSTSIDECHISAAPTYKRVLSNLDNAYRLSCTASFFRKGLSSSILSDYLSDVSVTMKRDDPVVPKIIWEESGVKWPSDHPMDYASYVLPALAKDMTRNAVIYGILKKCIEEGRVVAVVCITVNQAQFFNSLALKLGAKSIAYTGSTSAKKDKEIRDKIESGEINVINVVSKVSKGTDFSKLDAMILAKPTNSERDAIQIIGRVTRQVEGKPQPLVYDIRDKGMLAERFADNRNKWYSSLGYEL